jgi:Glycerophosphoryl diester phosphodiesterase family
MVLMVRNSRLLAALVVLVCLWGTTPAAPASAVAGTGPSAGPGLRAPSALRWTAPPLERAHAHNDYEHARPLLDALAHGFTSVEADVWLQGGELRVAHDSFATTPGRTLSSLYLDPLRRRVRENGGSAFAGWPGSLQLLVDIKSDGPTTYRELERVLARYPDIMTRWTKSTGAQARGPVTAVISGNRPLDLLRADEVRYTAYDGRLSDLGGGLPPSVMPLISDSWIAHFTWIGLGAMPADQRARLRDAVARAHAAGYRVRFYNTPDVPIIRRAVWRELLAAGVDQINTDDLLGLQIFLLWEDPAEGSSAALRPVAQPRWQKTL